MVKEKRILSYVLGWLILGYIICFIGINNVFAETYTPTEIKSQIRTIYTDGTTQWFTSANNNYTTPLYFGTGPSYSTYGIPCNFRLLVVNNIDTQYSYKYSYDMHIFTPYSTSNTWDSSKIDSQYELRVADDAGIVKESKCSVISTEKNTNTEGIFMNKSISCVFTVNKSYTNAYISAGYFCKGNCELSNMEPLGYIPQDSRMSIDNVKIERFNDNSNIIIDQNQTIIDQNNQTNEELGNIKDQIVNSNKETQDVIKDQFETCRPSNNIFDVPTIWSFNRNTNTPTNIPAGTYHITTGEVIKGGADAPVIIFNNQIVELTSNMDQIITFDTDITSYKYYSNGYSWVASEGITSTVKNLMISKNGGKYEPYGEEICSNRIDETNDKLDGIQGALTDSSTPNLDGLENSIGWLPPGPVDSILNLPLTMLNSLTNSLTKTCTPLNLTLPYVNKNIQIPCLNAIFAQITGVNGLWTWVGTIASVLILYNYLLNLYAWVDRVLTLRAEFDEAMGADLANWGRL